MIGGIADRAVLDSRFVKGERERLLAAAFMIRVIVLQTLMPEAQPGEVIIALAGDLALVPWSKRWRRRRSGPAWTGAGRSARPRWRNCRPPCWRRRGKSTGTVAGSP